MIVESEKTDADRILDTIRMKNEDLRRKYDQLMMDNNHRIHVQEHVNEIGEMKRLTGSLVRSQFFPALMHRLLLPDQLSEKHAHEMEVLLRRVQVIGSMPNWPDRRARQRPSNFVPRIVKRRRKSLN